MLDRDSPFEHHVHWTNSCRLLACSVILLCVTTKPRSRELGEIRLPDEHVWHTKPGHAQSGSAGRNILSADPPLKSEFGTAPHRPDADQFYPVQDDRAAIPDQHAGVDRPGFF